VLSGSVPVPQVTEIERNTEKYPQQPENLPDENTLVDWLVTVILAFFPIIASIIISLLRNADLDLVRMIGDGELVLSSFLLTTPSLINLFGTQKGSRRGLFYLLLFTSFLQLITYTTIKTNETNSMPTILVISLICIVSSILLSKQVDLHLKGG
jgi:hypothetical protein